MSSYELLVKGAPMRLGQLTRQQHGRTRPLETRDTSELCLVLFRRPAVEPLCVRTAVRKKIPERTRGLEFRKVPGAHAVARILQSSQSARAGADFAKFPGRRQWPHAWSRFLHSFQGARVGSSLARVGSSFAKLPGCTRAL